VPDHEGAEDAVGRFEQQRPIDRGFGDDRRRLADPLGAGPQCRLGRRRVGGPLLLQIGRALTSANLSNV
jgi:hypothetical protein